MYTAYTKLTDLSRMKLKSITYVLPLILHYVELFHYLVFLKRNSRYHFFLTELFSTHPKIHHRQKFCLVLTKVWTILNQSFRKSLCWKVFFYANASRHDYFSVFILLIE